MAVKTVTFKTKSVALENVKSHIFMLLEKATICEGKKLKWTVRILRKEVKDFQDFKTLKV